MPLICTIGEALYGPHWVRPLADTIKVSERTMRYWQDGTREPPPGIWRDLQSLCRDHAKRLEALATDLTKKPDPS